MIEWEKFKVIKKSANWGSPNLLSISLLRTLDESLFKLNTPVIITSGTAGIHATNSLHYQGRAIDFMLPSKKLSDLPDLAFYFMRFNFSGIGVYNSWRLHQNAPTQGGFHVELAYIWTEKKLWLEADKKYLALNLDNLNFYFRGKNRI